VEGLVSETAEGYRLSLDSHLEKLEQILKDNPDDPSALMAVGEVAFRRGRNLIALSAFHRLMEIKPEVIEVRLALAKIYGEQKMYDEAFRELSESFRIEGGNAEARVLYEMLAREATPPESISSSIQSVLSRMPDEDDLTVYLQQLTVEKERLTSDVRELTALLKTSSMDTILEYNKNMAVRRLSLINELEVKAQALQAPPQQKVKEAAAVPSKKEKEPGAQSPTLSEKEKAVIWLIGALDPILQEIKKTKGLRGLFVLGLRGEVFHAIDDDKIDSATLGKTLSLVLKECSAFPHQLIYWVVEFNEGLVVLQPIAPHIFLAMVADGSTSFGALRYLMDKGLPRIKDALQSVEVSALEA